MSQLALGLRALIVRLTVFFVMAAVLAWILGGTLFPSPQSVTFPPFEVGGVSYAWRVTGNAREAGPVSWSLVRSGESGMRPFDVGVPAPWLRTWGPLVHAGGALVGVECGAAAEAAGLWVAQIAPDGSASVRRVADESELLGTLRLPPGSGPNGG
ncbi:MAG: hypothetical protein FGM37_09135 [Phycisphaerales bacterium]|nr:hypothetical protein [Phycisphaerales bacterium]